MSLEADSALQLRPKPRCFLSPPSLGAKGRKGLSHQPGFPTEGDTGSEGQEAWQYWGRAGPGGPGHPQRLRGGRNEELGPTQGLDRGLGSWGRG